MAQLTNAQRITERMEATGRVRSKDSIYSVVMDNHHVQCLTEPMLDVWWHELKPEDKAALYELHLDGFLDKPEPKPKVKFNFDFTGFDAASAELKVALGMVIAGILPEIGVTHV